MIHLEGRRALPQEALELDEASSTKSPPAPHAHRRSAVTPSCGSPSPFSPYLSGRQSTALRKASESHRGSSLSPRAW